MTAVKKYEGTYVRCGYRQAWIMWDMSNGHSGWKRDCGKGFLWVFQTREAARAHRKKQHAEKLGARLSSPVNVFK